MSDLQVTILDLVAAGIGRHQWHAEGTNDGELMGMPPTGKRSHHRHVD